MPEKRYPDYRAFLKYLFSTKLPVSKKKSAENFIPTGITGLDDMLNGGYPARSAIAVAGGTDSCKTVFALRSFLSRKFNSEEQGLIISLEEDEAKIKSIARSMGKPLSKRISFLHLLPLQLEENAFIYETAGLLAEKKIKHVLINSLSAVNDLHEKRTVSFIKAFISLLNYCRVSSLLCYKTESGKPGERMSSDYVFELSDMVINLDYVKNPKGIDRYLQVQKMRGFQYDPGVRQLVFSEKGELSVNIVSKSDPNFSKEYVFNAAISMQDPYLDKEITRMFKKKYPQFSLEVSAGLSKGFVNDLERDISAGKCGYDIVSLHVPDYQRFVREGLLTPVTGSFKSYEHLYYPELLNNLRYKGELYGIPWGTGPVCLVYRRDLFEKYGFASVGGTLPEFYGQIQLILKKEKGIKDGMVFGPDNLLPEFFMKCALTFGPGREDSGLTPPRIKAALQSLYDGYFKQGVLAFKLTGEKGFEVQNLIMNRNFVAMYYPGYGMVSGLIKRNPRLNKIYGFAELPPLSASSGNNTGFASGVIYAVPVTARFPDYCAEVITFLAGKEVSLKVRETGNYPTLTANMEVNKKLEEKYFYLKSGGEMLENCIYPPRELGDPDYCRILMENIKRMLDKEAGVEQAALKIEQDLRLWTRSLLYDRIINEVRRYLEKNYNRDLDMKDVAAKAGLSYSFFAKLFRKKNGCSVFDYMMKLRIENAKKMLEQNYRSNISEIAVKTGFTDLNYFSRAFKKQTGFSPSEFRIRQANQ